MVSFSPFWEILGGKAIAHIPTLCSTVKQGKEKGTWPPSDISIYSNNFCSFTTIKKYCLNVVWSCNNQCANCSQKADKSDESNHVLFHFQWRGDALQKSVLFCTQLERISQITGSNPLITTDTTSSNSFQKLVKLHFKISQVFVCTAPIAEATPEALFSNSTKSFHF